MIPAGRHYCPRCVRKTDFILGDGASPDDQTAPLECYVCGYTYDKVVREIDAKTGATLPAPRREDALGLAARRRAIEEMRQERRVDAVRSGTRLEAFRRTTT